jgi:CysZ protein
VAATPTGKQPELTTFGSRPAAGFWSALRYPWRGARFVYVEHPELARFWVPPILVTFGLLVVAGWLAIDVHGAVTEWLWSTPTGSGWLATVERFAHLVLDWLIAALMLGAAVVAVALVSGVIAAPFNDALSEAVESTYLSQPRPSFSLARVARDVVRTVALELLKLCVYAAVMLPLFAVSLAAPVVAPAVQVVGFGFTALFFAVDYVDWPAARREWPARARMRWAFSHLRAMLGLGTGVWLLLFVPLLNLLFMPAAVAGGTLLFLDLAARAPALRPSGA